MGNTSSHRTIGAPIDIRTVFTLSNLRITGFVSILGNNSLTNSINHTTLRIIRSVGPLPGRVWFLTFTVTLGMVDLAFFGCSLAVRYAPGRVHPHIGCNRLWLRSHTHRHSPVRLAGLDTSAHAGGCSRPRPMAYVISCDVMPIHESQIHRFFSLITG